MNLIYGECLRTILVIVGEEKFIIVYIRRVNKDIDDLLLEAIQSSKLHLVVASRCRDSGVTL